MRYARNGILSDEAQAKLFNSKVLIVGAGGLGGYILELLTRIGVGHITLVDGDVFEESNMNRQLLSSPSTIGKSKAEIGKKRALEINPELDIISLSTRLDKNNGSELVKGHDLVFDALDSIADRFILAEACGLHGLPMVHGAIAGWMGQVAFIHPGDVTLRMIYPSDHKDGYEVEMGNPSFTPALVASIQVSEGIKYLTQTGEVLRQQILCIDLATNQFTVISL